MHETSPTPEERYSALTDELIDRIDTGPPSKGFGSGALKVGGRIFAMLAGGRLVVKLPRRRVDALVAAGGGERFDPGHGRVMKEWLSLAPGAEDDWLDLATEALAFVGG